MESQANGVTLVRAAQRGDRSAFARLYDEYAGLVRATAVTRLRGDEAADVVQETFLRALRRLKHLRKAEAFAGWLVAIARNRRSAIGRTSSDSASTMAYSSSMP